MCGRDGFICGEGGFEKEMKEMKVMESKTPRGFVSPKKN